MRLSTATTPGAAQATIDGLSHPLGSRLLYVAHYGAIKSHHTVLRSHANLGSVNARLPFELGATSESKIGQRRLPSFRTGSGLAAEQASPTGTQCRRMARAP